MVQFKRSFLNKRVRVQLILINKSSHRRCFIRKAVLKNFAIFKGNTCVRVLKPICRPETCCRSKNYFKEHLQTAASTEIRYEFAVTLLHTYKQFNFLRIIGWLQICKVFNFFLAWFYSFKK